MTRPPVSIVIPFAGERAAADGALRTLAQLETRLGDELILADNSGSVGAVEGVTVLAVGGERSPAHARNEGAAQARNEWILFLDADCLAPPALLDAYFAQPIADDVGALAGEVVASSEDRTLVARYGASKSFLSQRAHLAHSYRPRAVAANLLVRRAAFEHVGGFYEGVRAAEDTDFSWRIQEAGWRIELRPDAVVEHRYRSTLGELRRQWRGYAAGRAWLGRRYGGFEPEPAARRALSRAWSRARRGLRPASRSERPSPSPTRPLDRGRFALIDVLLAAEELAGLALSNRPVRPEPLQGAAARVVLVAERFPARGDPLVDLAQTLDGARVEAAARPEIVDVGSLRELDVVYREDDGGWARALSLALLLARHPLRCTTDLMGRSSQDPPLRELAPAAIRIRQFAGVRVQPLGGDPARRAARRLAALTGRSLQEGRRRRPAAHPVRRR